MDESFRVQIFTEPNIFSSEQCQGQSLVSQAFVKVRRLIIKNTCFKIGYGFYINFRFDPWIPTLPNEVPKLKDRILEDLPKRVEKFRGSGSNDWNVELLRCFFEEEFVGKFRRSSGLNFNARISCYGLEIKVEYFHYKTATMLPLEAMRITRRSGERFGNLKFRKD